MHSTDQTNDKKIFKEYVIAIKKNKIELTLDFYYHDTLRKFISIPLLNLHDSEKELKNGRFKNWSENPVENNKISLREVNGYVNLSQTASYSVITFAESFSSMFSKIVSWCAEHTTNNWNIDFEYSSVHEIDMFVSFEEDDVAMAFTLAFG